MGKERKPPPPERKRLKPNYSDYLKQNQMKFQLLSAIVATVSALTIATTAQAAEFKGYRDGTNYVCATSPWTIRSAANALPVGRLATGECMQIEGEINSYALVSHAKLILVRGASGKLRMLALSSSEIRAYLNFLIEGDE